MNPHLQSILNFLQQDKSLSVEEKSNIIKSLQDADKDLGITSFKLDRTEKVKRTTAILLEETIEELEHKRKAVEAQNRELEIETALEKVRAVAMGMRQPEDMLDVCRITSQQLDLLNIKEIRNVQTAIFNQQKGIYLNYEFFRLHDKTTTTEVEYNLQPDVKDFVNQMLTDPEAFFTTAFEGAKLKDWMEYQEKAKQFVDPHLYEVKSLHYYFYSIGPGALGISTYAPLNDNELAVFKRFRNVFELAYRRFIDIEQAHAQARESQIQLAMERVRARTMAMQRSSELAEVASLLFKQVADLGIKLWSTAFQIWNADDISTTAYASAPDGSIQAPFRLPYNEDIFFKQIYKARQRGEDLFVMESSGKELEETYHYMFNLPGVKKYFDDALDSGFAIPKFQITHCAFFSQGYVMFITYEPVPEAGDIFKRFGKVFEQTYTRFLDLQKAEAQARESQIQLALERVRARTMAMQRSSELAEVASLLFTQIADLGTKQWSSGFDIWNENEVSAVAWMSNPDGSMGKPFTVPYTEDTFFKQIYEAKQSGNDFFVMESSGKELEETYQYLFNLPDAKKHFDGIESLGFQMPKFQITHCVFFAQGFLMFITYETVPEMWDIFQRFGKVFEQTYTRFLDLQKAESQARESQIQLALERVRARTMAMQKSDELSDAVYILFQQFKELGEKPDQATIGVINEDEKVIEYWVTMYGNPINKVFKFSLDEPNVTGKIYKAWKENKKSLVIDLSGDALTEFMTYRAGKGGAALNPDEKRRIINVAFFSKGLLNVQFNEERSEESIKLLERFALVFEQTYTRFLDLQKAEAQAREAHIEAALERVRARTIGMQKSDELQSAALLLFQQVQALGAKYFACGFNIWDEDRKSATAWMAREDALQPPFKTSSSKDVFLKIFEAAKRGESLFVEEQGGKKLEEHYRDMASVPVFRDVMEKMLQAGVSVPTFQIIHCAFFSQGYLMFISYESVAEVHDIFKRFAKVFEQTYTRFLDLQKAEAQAKESQIQLALERVRARTMAMQKSDELSETAYILSQQFKALGESLIQITIGIINEDDGLIEFWVTDLEGNKNDRMSKASIDEPTLIRKMYTAWKEEKKSTIIELTGKELVDWVNYRNKLSGTTDDNDYSNSRRYVSVAFFSKGLISLSTPELKPKETIDLLERFATVFDLTYTRFLDLKNVEAQARESKIEAELERVRGKAMAMHNSNDLSVTASMIFTGLRKLGINPIRCGVGLLNKESRKAQLYSASSSPAGDSLALIGWVVLSDHPVLENIYDTWLRNEDYYPELSGEELKSYYELLLAGLSVTVPDWEGGQKQYGHFLPFSVGCLYAWSEIHYNDAEINILKRFASIIDLTFRRYIELQKSEANAREAVKQAALDRIRADIASMRTIADLNRITPLIWNELTILGIPFIRSGVFIMDDSQGLIHTFLSTPDGKAIGAFHLPYTTTGNIARVLSHWQKKKNYIDHWDERAFAEFADILVKQGALASPEQYLKTSPQAGFYLHFLPFLQGMLYVGNTTQLNGDEIKLIQSVADAFSTAYARYEDFNKLEAAKKQVDSTLNELRVTQKQLIQSEKMASLGELTAGIAHEIQNPLNFVNNFSEVNKELLIEMKEEMDQGHMDDAKAIATDVIENEEKINHHGKRADAIVKGMLQHSRSSSGVKEPVGINALTDEYLRLAYHGLRAKDKNFNATMQTDYDETVGNINIIPQDIGRVILNLITNSFYAVTEKKKLQPGGYEPTVFVRTKKINDKVEIIIQDNGNGIPQKILDKIFQPFFTTKPTGQGTGLGLSMSYDIIKAHGGEIKVETKACDGAKFIIQLPGTI